MRTHSNSRWSGALGALFVVMFFLCFSAIGSLIAADAQAADVVAVAQADVPADDGDLPAAVAEWGQLLLAFVGFFAALSAVTKSKRDDTWAGYLVRLVDVLGLNVGNAKNRNGPG